MKKNSIEKLALEIVEPITDELQFELVDIEYIKEGPNMYLRIYIDKPGGINLDDCQKASEMISEKLDEKDPIEENYFLEVSSPGLDRPLKNEKDFKRNIGKDIEISLYSSLNGSKKLVGKLLDFDDKNIYIEDENLEKINIEKSIASKINLAIKF